MLHSPFNFHVCSCESIILIRSNLNAQVGGVGGRALGIFWVGMCHLVLKIGTLF